MIEDIPGRSLVKVQAGSPVQGLVPTTLEEAFRLAAHIFESGLAPRGLDKPQAVMVVIMKGLEIGLQPMAALETIGVINGRACLYGDGIPALLWSRGFKIKEWYENEDDLENCVAHCRITRPDGEVYEFKYSAQDARDNKLWDAREKITRRTKDGKTYQVDNDQPWYRYKKRMIRHRARGWLARDCASDVLKGMPMFEEERDIQLAKDEYNEIDVTPKVVAPPPPDEDDEAPASNAEPSPDTTQDTTQNAAAISARPCHWE